MLVSPSAWAMVTVVPMRSSCSTLATVPAAAAITWVPTGAAMSTPEWVRQSPMVSS